MKKIRAFILIILCCVNISNVKSQPYFQNIQEIISICSQSPIMIVLFFCFIYYKKLCFIHHHKRNILSRNESTNVRTISIKYNQDDANYTLHLTSHGAAHKYHNVHNFEMSPHNNYLLISSLIEVPALHILFHMLFKKAGVKTITQNAFHLVPMVYLIDVITGKKIQSFENASCSFSPDEQVLLICEEASISKIKLPFYFLQKKIFPQEQENIVHNDTKNTAHIQYRLFDIRACKNITVLPYVRSVRFVNEHDVIIVDNNGNDTYFTLTKPVSVLSSLNPFSSPMRPVQIYDKKNCFLPHLEYHLDNKAYNLDVTIQNGTHDIKKAKRYVSNGNYLLVNTEYQQISTLIEIIKNLGHLSAEEIVQEVINIIEKPQAIPQIIDLNNGIITPLFSCKNPILCSFIPNEQALFIIELNNKKPNKLIYKKYDIVNKKFEIFYDAQKISFILDNPYIVTNSHNTPCTMKSKGASIVQQSISSIETAATNTIEKVAPKVENFVNHMCSTILSVPAVLPNPIPEDHKPTIDHQTTYKTYPFTFNVLSQSQESQTNYMGHLESNRHGLIWNIYSFGLSWPNTLDDYIFQPQKNICISHCSPKDMKYFTYQSLTGELKSVLKHMKQHKNAIVSIILKSNDCTIGQIEGDIQKALTDTKYNPLLTPKILQQKDKSLDEITVEEMIDKKNNNRLLLFCDKHSTETIFSLSSTENPCILKALQ